MPKAKQLVGYLGKSLDSASSGGVLFSEIIQQKIEKVTELRPSKIAWQEIEFFTQQYIFLAAHTRRATTTKTLALKLKKMNRLAEDIRCTLEDEAAPATIAFSDLRDDWVARNEAFKKIISDYFQVQRVKFSYYGDILIPAYIHALRGVIVMGDFVVEDLRDGAGVNPNTAWTWWITFLTAMNKKYKLPYKVSKGLSLKTEASEFVLFVSELQKVLPKELRRHEHSLGALSQAISRSRAEKSQS